MRSNNRYLSLVIWGRRTELVGGLNFLERMVFVRIMIHYELQ